jgi:hypothetical protein
MRKLIFGMLDGSNLDQFGVQKTENGWPVIYRVASVFNDPSKKTQILNPELLDAEKPLELTWEELSQYPDLLKSFSDKRSSIDGESQKELAKLVKLNEELISKSARLDALKAHLEEIQPPKSSETEPSETEDEKSEEVSA